MCFLDEGKEKRCTEGESQRCGFCRCRCMHLFLLSDFKRVRDGFFAWDQTVYPQAPEKERRMPVSSGLLTIIEKLRSVYHSLSSPLTPWSTPYCQHISTYHISTQQGSGWGSSKEKLNSHLRRVHGTTHPERKCSFLPNLFKVVCLFRCQAVKGHNYLLNDGLILDCRCWLADLPHTLSIMYLLCYFTSHIHTAKSVVVSDDPLMVFIPCTVPQLGSQNRNMIALPRGKKPLWNYSGHNNCRFSLV